MIDGKELYLKLELLGCFYIETYANRFYLKISDSLNG
jgi:hypothetical protein